MFRILNLIIGVFLILISSCIPREKVIYIQNSKEFTYQEQDTIQLKETFIYKLKPGDVLSIRLSSITPEKFNLQQLEQKNNTESPLLSGYLIDQDGHVDVPFIGKIEVGGLDINQAREKIQDLAKDKLINPQISVRLLTYTFTILGEVNKPGTYSSYKDRITIFEALGLAGDLTDYADRKFIKLIRGNNGKSHVTYLNLIDDQFMKTDFVYIRPGDIVYAPPLKAKNYAKYQLPNIALGISMLTLISLLFVRIN